MMIKVKVLNSLVSKVSTAVGADDKIRISFISQGEQHLCSLVAYDGKSLEFQQIFVYEGDAEADGAYIVKASDLSKALALYEQLGVESITLEAEENALVFKDGSGSTTLSLLDKMVSINDGDMKNGVVGSFTCPLKQLQECVKVASIAIHSSPDNALYGVYCELDSEGKAYTLYASDAYIGTRTQVTCDIILAEGADIKGMSFFVQPAFVKAVGALKGETVSGIVTDKYLLLKDEENTLAVVSLNGTAFPLSFMHQTFVKLADEMKGTKTYAKVSLPQNTLMAAAELCSVASSKSDGKVVKMNFADGKFRISELSDKSARAIDNATVVVEDTEKLEKHFTVELVRRALKAVSTDKVTVRLTSTFDLFYNEGAEYPISFLTPRKQ